MLQVSAFTSRNVAAVSSDASSIIAAGSRLVFTTSHLAKSTKLSLGPSVLS